MIFGLPALYAKLIGGVAALALVAGAVAWHQHSVSSAYNRGKLDEADHIAAKALALKAETDALTTNISTIIRDQNDAENRRIYDSARALLMRGPGRAACAGSAGIPAAAGGSEPAGGASGATVPRLSYPNGEQLIGVPFASAVGFAEQHDTNRAEVLSWRDWYTKEKGAWPTPVPPKKKRKLWPF